MCLAFVDKVCVPKPVVKMGYHLFQVKKPGAKTLYPYIYQPDGMEDSSTPVPRRKWLRSVEVEIPAANGEAYKTGFHIYTAKKNARMALRRSSIDPVIAAVYYRNKTYEGRQNGLKVIVAQEMYVL